MTDNSSARRGLPRRSFIRGACASACGFVTGVARSASTPARITGRRTRAHGVAAVAPVGGVLELFMYGGLCPWDTFYCVPSWDQDSQRYLHAFDLNSALAACCPPALLEMFEPGQVPTRAFGYDGSGTPIHLGPWTWPLWSRPDILSRMRVVVTAHDQFPHATAIPLALTGFRLGSPELTGMGALVEGLAGGESLLPRSAVIRSGREPVTDNLAATLAVGPHRDAARPLDLNLANVPLLYGLLDRPATQGRARAHDALIELSRKAYRSRLQGSASSLRAPALDAFDRSDARRAAAGELSSLLPPSLFGLPLASSCGETRVSVPKLAARVASHLLTREADQRSRYVLWVDDGLRPTLDGGHDTHREHLLHASVNYPHTLQTLADRINRPGELDPDKIDLDDTLIAITSEFGRTPQVEDDRQGLGHWPHGYVNVLIGGKAPAASGPESGALVGAIDGATGLASEYCTPTELRMALLLALGYDPMLVDGWGASSVRGANNDVEALARLAGILGVQT